MKEEKEEVGEEGKYPSWLTISCRAEVHERSEPPSFRHESVGLCGEKEGGWPFCFFFAAKKKKWKNIIEIKTKTNDSYGIFFLNSFSKAAVYSLTPFTASAKAYNGNHF